jgi:hypothetical protein
MSSEPLELPGDTEFTFFRIHVGAAAAAPRRGATIAGRSSIRSPCGHRRNRTLQFARCTPGESPTKGRFCSGATILRRYAREFCQVLSRLGRSGCPRIRSATYSVHTACAVLADRNAHRDSLTGRPPDRLPNVLSVMMSSFATIEVRSYLLRSICDLMKIAESFATGSALAVQF